MKTLSTTVNKRVESLRNCLLFSNVEQKDLSKLADCCLLRQYQPGEILFMQETKADGFYVIVTGEAEVFRSSPDGREQVLHDFTGGEVCGEVPVFHGGGYPASARARSELTALYIPGADFIRIAESAPHMLLEMLAVLSMRLRKFTTLVDDLSLKDVVSRLGSWLLQNEKDGTIVLSCTKSELAARLGTIPETLSRSLGKLKKSGIITDNGSRLEVTNRTMLENLAQGGKL